MAENVIQAKRIELLDSEGNTSIILKSEGSGAAGLMTSTPGEDAPIPASSTGYFALPVAAPY